ncbi:phage repressor protein [Deltaproteobacteria bacterium]|nr:phage repressor protein [Deltaproteobacteria bacterium]
MNQKERAIADLRAGNTTKYKGHGNSMNPRIKSGAVVTLEPITNLADLEVGDAVFCKVKGNIFTHVVSALKGGVDNRQVQISNLRGRVNGWTTTVYGRVIHVEQP